MVFGIICKDGFMPCKCCKDKLYHCKRCWDEYHNGEKHKDYEPPAHYGQKIYDDELFKIMKEKHRMEFKFIIKEDKNRKYKEGEYH